MLLTDIINAKGKKNKKKHDDKVSLKNNSIKLN